MEAKQFFIVLKGVFSEEKLNISVLGAGALLLLSACGRSDVTSHSTGLWERLILMFGKAIQGLSFGGSIGLGIIIFTILIRAVMIPLYNRQIKSSRELQELQPELRRLQSEYPGRENREALAYAQQDLYKEHGVNPYASFVPLLIQFPILMALYGALTRVPELREGTFLWVDLGQKDPYFILPILAAAFTFLSTWLTNKAAKDRSAMLLVMNIMLPIFIFWFGTQISSGVALYWAVSNAFQVVQILVLIIRLKSLKNVIVWKRKKKNAKLRFVVPRKRRINVNKEAYYGCLFWTNSRTSYRKGLKDLNLPRMKAHIKVISREKKVF